MMLMVSPGARLMCVVPVCRLMWELLVGSFMMMFVRSHPFWVSSVMV